ncbi:FGGY-family carbohydrate kinase [Companilactobacillus bobalius]|uniref:ATP:glycerol 3-phosphotransferase n=2 Tax=Companilactobacillus bobalius TaxID=2801451 RepID=A0A202FDS0_9LACO|nr:glycerol kinase GlpK [Companilactobacillus bobalius]KAE9556939.1 glycerol kinase [Companilactobacillus bobalius]KRK81859.1 glycerol kinase [Companilactobacillus bobalius DSM 19674]OVE98590.1 Glycerol kinase [Companilactobacillus bobalius]GEO59014.1 glycerol kinase [Companilactobacillus paralimentarius]
MKYLLGIDQSTQGTKVVLVDKDGQILRKVTRNHRQIINKQGWVSHDLREIYQNILFLVRKILDDPQVDSAKIVGLGITNQRETATAWSKSTRKPLSESVVWQCSRAKDVCERIEKTGVGQSIYQKTGMPLSPYFTASKFTWLLENIPEVQEAAQKGDLCLGTVDSWLIYQLTRGQSFKTEPSNASRTQLMNLKSGDWDDDLLRIFDLKRSYLAKIVDSNDKFGMTDFEGILNHQIPIYGVLGDSQAALFGQRCTKFGDVKSTYGTGSSIMMNIGSKPVMSSNGLITSVAWKINGQSNYVLEGNVNYSGAVIKWLKDDLGLIEHSAETEEMAYHANKSDKTYLVPAFTGLGAPYWNDDATGTIVGMTRKTRKNEVVKAGLESIAYQINDILQLMKKDTGGQINILKVDGGATSNNYLMQFQCDLLQSVLKIPNVEELSVLGAVFLAGLQLDLYDENVLQEAIEYRCFEPKMAVNECNEKVQGWKKAVSLINV